MAIVTAAGTPNLSGSYIKTLYAKNLLVEFYKSTVFGEIASTEYEKMVKEGGDKVTIRTLPDIVVKNHVRGQDLEYDSPEPSTVVLHLDQEDYIAFRVTEGDMVQADIPMIQKWSEHSAKNLKIEVDSAVLSGIYGDAHASNKGLTAGVDSGDINLGTTGTPLQLTAANILDKIVDMGTVLDEQDVPEEGRWLVLPPWACGLIKKSDLKDASLAGDGTSIMRNGRIGMIDRFTIYNSRNLATATDGADKVWNCLFGHKIGVTFATQHKTTDILDSERQFGKFVRSLWMYGFKVVKPEALGLLYVKK